MPKVTDIPPKKIKEELDELSTILDGDIPAKKLDKNLLIATWNIRGFGDLTEKWESSNSDSPKRDLHALHCIAEIISRFDVIAIQEAKQNIKALRHTIKLLGSNWGLILTDVTKGDAGNGERMAYLFDKRKVQLSGLACEIVIPFNKNKAIKEDALDKQFARSPYAVSFKSGNKTFILVTLHVLYGKAAKDRTPELKAIATWLSDWAQSIHAYSHNLIALGDFNIDRKGDARYEAFTSTGLTAPEDLNLIPRSIFDKPGKSDKRKFYDQIAWFQDSGTSKKSKKTPLLSLKYIKGGYFDFTKICLKDRGLTKSQLSWRISDHFPLWTEFSMEE